MDMIKLAKVEIWWDELTEEEKIKIYDNCQMDNRMTEKMIK